MATVVDMEYYVIFGRNDGSDRIPWCMTLEEEAEKAYLRAKKFRKPLDKVPELEEVLKNAYSDIEEEEIQNFIDCDDEYTLELTGRRPVDADTINELVKERDPYTLKFFDLTEMTDEELEEWDANDLFDLPDICDFEEGFEPQSPFDQGWDLVVYFAESPEEEPLDEDEAIEALKELFSNANGNYEEVEEYISCCEDLYEGDDLASLAVEIAENFRITDYPSI